MNHTPGPWRWKDELILAGGDPETRHGKIIAESPGGSHWEDDSEDEANANLIAAAPDLLEALEAIVEGYRASPEASLQLWIAAETAIKKAKGKQ